MKLRREDVIRVAELAHLELTDEEIETYSRQLDSILRYVEKLNELDTANIEPMAQVLSAAEGPDFALRDDVARPADTAREVLEQAAQASKPYFRVPKVIEK